VEYVRGLLEQIGLGAQRIGMYNLSSAMAQKFAEAATEMTERIRAMGPNPLRKEVSGSMRE